MKKRAVIMAALASLFVCGLTSAASAGSAGNGTVTQYWIDGKTNLMTINLAGNGLSACNTSNGWVVDLSTPAGQCMANAIMIAFLSKKPVYITGSGTCVNGTDLVQNLVQ